MKNLGARMNVRVIGVEVLVDVEHETSDATVRVFDFVERVGGAVRDEGLGRGPVVAGKENELRSCTEDKRVVNIAGPWRRR